MNPESERSTSFWSADFGLPHRPSLMLDAAADVVVVGAGIAGLSAAYELSCAGLHVVVLDRGPMGGGMTSRTTAHLASDWDDYYYHLISLRDVEEARLIYESQAAAIDRIEHISEAEQIACDFVRLDGFLVEAPEHAGSDLLERELEACHEVGFTGVSLAPGGPLPGSRRSLSFPRQGRLHPRKYLNGLIGAVEGRGGQCFGNTPATHVEESGNSVTVHLENGRSLRAGAALIATNAPITDKVAILAKQAPYRTYALAGEVPRNTVRDALIWDTEDPYHYVRLQPVDDDRAMLIVGGEDHKAGEARDMDDRLAALEGWARDNFPSMRDVQHRWSGQVYEPADTVPFIGRDAGAERVFIATGDSGQGMTTGVVAGIILRDLVLKRSNPWAEVYDPRRISAKALGEVARENVTTVRQMAKHLLPGELGSMDELRPGQGAIVRAGLQKLAAYRAASGRLYVHSATCTHAGCVVEWNPFELCWDCPCHGSQFAPEGGVLNGPAVHPLKPAEG